MLATGPLITEFLASNNSTLDDGDGNSSDWVELYNPTATTVDLSDWHLTDDASNLNKWTFPTAATIPQDVLDLEPGEFLIVFASGQESEDYIDAGGNLHTDFKLSAGGEYLALVRPGGVTVEYEYAPEYPIQATDVSYGLSFDSANTVLVAEGADAKYTVPTGPINGWNELSFDDSGWSTGATGIGYENSPADYDAFIETTVSGGTVSAYLRQTFSVLDPTAVSLLTLQVRYDDGFLAYLNGELVASQNSPDSPQWNSNATSNHSDTAAIQFEPFELDDYADHLVVGDNVLAIQALNRNNSSSDMLIEAKLESSMSSLREPLDVGIFPDPSPRAANGESFLGLVEDTTVSVERGFYDSPFSVDLSAPTPGATLVYTTDGSEPSLTNGVQILPANANMSAHTNIVVAATTSLRTASFKPDFFTPGPTTHTYVFLDDVIASDVMDTNITQDPEYAPLLRQSLLDLPTLSFNYENEIVDSNVPEQRASIEWLAPDGSEGFQIDAGIHGFGGYFTNFAKKNFRLHFRSKYGDSRLDFPLFEGFDNGIPATESFDSLNFRSGSHDMVARGFYMSNRFVDDTLQDLGHVAPHGRFVHIYINGTYWGQYHMRERWDADFLAQYYGGDDDDYEAVNGNVNNGNDTPGGWSPGEVYDGEGTAWDNINALMGNYQALSQFVDMKNYIDFMLLFMAGNSENEYRSGGSADGSVPYTFFLNDADGWLRSPAARFGNPGPANILGSLVNEADPDFLTLYADRIQNMFFNDGVLTAEQSTARLQDRLDEVELSFLAESARWDYRTPSSWESAANNAIKRILPAIPSRMIANLRARGAFPINAPEFNQFGGIVSSGFPAEIASGDPGTDEVYYTIDGSDPRLPGGGVNTGSALIYDAAKPPIITATTIIRTRSLDGSLWSPINSATFVVPNADFNGDGIVDAADFTVWRDNLGTTGISPGSGADGNGDGEVNEVDYQLWISQFGMSFPPAAAATTASAIVHRVPRAALRAAPAVVSPIPTDAAATIVNTMPTLKRVSQTPDVHRLETRMLADAQRRRDPALRKASVFPTAVSEKLSDVSMAQLYGDLPTNELHDRQSQYVERSSTRVEPFTKRQSQSVPVEHCDVAEFVSSPCHDLKNLYGLEMWSKFIVRPWR